MTDPRLRLWTALLATAVSCGCSSLDNCPNGTDTPIVIDTGTTDKAALTFESAPWDGKLDAFPAKTQLEFKHDLGVTPLLVKAYLSFRDVGTNDHDGGSVTEIAGNEGPLECVDSHVIVVKNDTCENGFFIRVVAIGASPSSSPDVKCGEKLAD
jgi:hypothetical protein